MNKRHLQICLLTIIYLLQITAVPALAADNRTAADNTAYVLFSEKPETQNVSSVSAGLVDNPVIAERDGEQCWLMDKQNKTASQYINLVFDKDFVDETKTATYDFEVDYYDYGQGYFSYFYNSLKDNNQYGDTFYLEDDRVWKTAKFTVNDAVFEKGIDGMFDFRLSITLPHSVSCAMSSSSVGIKRIEVKRNDDANPIYVDSDIDESGAAFEWFAEKKIIHDHFENRSDKVLTVNVRRMAAAPESQTLLFDETVELSFEPFEKKDIDFDFGKYNTCEQYDYKIFITSEENKISSEFVPIRFAVIKTDPDGIKNRNVFLGSHVWQHPETIPEAVDVLRKTNIGGMRVDVPWWLVEDKKAGEYHIWDTSVGEYIKTVRENDMEVLALISQMSFLYTKNQGNNPYPSTPEQFTAYRNMLKWLVPELESLGGMHYEVYNEPDVKIGRIQDDGNPVSGATYVPVYNATLEEVKAINPKAKVMGAATCWASTSPLFLQSAIDAGWAKTIDVFSGHPYNRVADEMYTTEESLKEWKTKIAETGGPKDIEVWASEVGYTPADASVGNVKNQANWLARKAYYLRAVDAADTVGLFTFEGRGMCRYDREDMYGMAEVFDADIRRNAKPYMPRVPLLEVAAECYVMADSVPTGKVYERNNNFRAYEYKSNKFNANILAMNTMSVKTSRYETVTMQLNCGKVDWYDEFGNMKTVYGDNGKFTFTVDERPQYIVGDFKNVQLLDENLVEYDANIRDSSFGDTTQISINKPASKDYTVKVNCGYGLSVVGDAVFEGDTAKILIDVNVPQGKFSYLGIDIMDGDKIVNNSWVKIQSNEPVVVNMTTSLINTNNFNNWNGEMRIKNTSQTKSIRGYVEFTYPKLFAGLGKLDFGTIARNRTGRLKITLPPITEKGEFTVEYNVVIDDESPIHLSSSLDFTSAVYAEKKPKIDGIIENGEWREDSAMYWNSSSQYFALLKDQPWKNTKDLSGKMVVEWDEENFYFMAEIEDDVHYNGSPINQMYMGDSIQFGVYYGSEGYIVAGQGSTTYHEFTLGDSNQGPKAYRHLSQSNSYPEGEPEDYEIAITTKGTKTYYEFKIPWKKLLKEGQQPKEGNVLGFSALVNENDGTGRRGWLEYASGIGQGKNTQLFTYIKLYK